VFSIIRAKWLSKDLLKASISPGKPLGRVTGGWIADMIGLRKSLTLCEKTCTRRFKPRSEGYDGPIEIAGYQYVYSTCDGCRETAVKCHLFEPSERRR